MEKLMKIFRRILDVALLVIFGIHYWNDSLSGMIFIGVLLIANLLFEVIDSIDCLSNLKNVNIENITYHEALDKVDIGHVSELKRR